MKLSIFGAAPDTNNLGVNALCYATIYNLLKEDPSIDITVFDFGKGIRLESIMLGGLKLKFARQGAVYSRRYYRSENLQMNSLVKKITGISLPVIQRINDSNAVLDISGGDSFTDLYGQKGFNSNSLTKLLVIGQNKPLILLPQTYGPFNNERNRDIASSIIKKVNLAWARDHRSYGVLKKLSENGSNSEKYKCGVDVAFGLPVIKPLELTNDLERLLRKDELIKVGINVSGLLYNNPSAAEKQFGFKIDYNAVIKDLVEYFLNSEKDAHIFLIPHVFPVDNYFESDLAACQDLAARVAGVGGQRVTVLPSFDNPCEIKWIISKMDWFSGMRMHACIASLSSNIPASAISYSPKTLGVFESCGLGDHVADPTRMEQTEVLDKLIWSWHERDKSEKTLAKKIPQIQNQVRNQFLDILDYMKSQL